VPSAEAGTPPAGPPSAAVACVDVGSTCTKAVLVDPADGTLLGRAEHPTTIDTDVLDGVDACLIALGLDPGTAYDGAGGPDARVLLCSSAGGGLRIAVVGNEALVTAEAGRRVALSSGGVVVAVAAVGAGGAGGAVEVPLPLDPAVDLGSPDVVLLTGGTDGGNTEAPIAAARALVAGGWQGPVVYAGNPDARDRVAEVLDGRPVATADNVVPRIGVLHPDGARSAVREVFLRHVIGGKGLSSRGGGRAFADLVRGATPDLVLTGVETLASVLADAPDAPDVPGGRGDVVVVDVGGATTDVHSVVDVDPEQGAGGTAGPGLSREVVAPTALTRTVEGGLGVRWSAVTTLDAGPDPDPAATPVADLAGEAGRRTADPGLLAATATDWAADEAIARRAAGWALRRHAGRSRVVVGPDGRVVERTGVDLRKAALVVASGGVLRHGPDGVVHRVLAGSVGPGLPGGWQLPEAARVVVDADYVLAAVGLLADLHPAAARGLARGLLASTSASASA